MRDGGLLDACRPVLSLHLQEVLLTLSGVKRTSWLWTLKTQTTLLCLRKYTWVRNMFSSSPTTVTPDVFTLLCQCQLLHSSHFVPLRRQLTWALSLQNFFGRYDSNIIFVAGSFNRLIQASPTWLYCRCGGHIQVCFLWTHPLPCNSW